MRLKRLVIIALCVIFFIRAAPAKVVSIWDKDLRAAILKKLNKLDPKAAITKSDMLRLTELRLENVGISDLTGLEHATNLTELKLLDNAVSNISPLTGLTNLTVLWLAGNDLTDVSPLATLTQLSFLGLPGNFISDISSLTVLTDLKVLDLRDNRLNAMEANSMEVRFGYR